MERLQKRNPHIAMSPNACPMFLEAPDPVVIFIALWDCFECLDQVSLCCQHFMGLPEQLWWFTKRWRGCGSPTGVKKIWFRLCKRFCGQFGWSRMKDCSKTKNQNHSAWDNTLRFLAFCSEQCYEYRRVHMVLFCLIFMFRLLFFWG